MELKNVKQFALDVRRAVEEEKIPGAVLLAGRRGDVWLHEACGYAQLIPERDDMRKDTCFDIASLTKLTGTWPAIMLLLQSGRLTLDTKMPDMLHRPMHPALREVTLWNLLTHTAGFIPDMWPDIFGKTRRERIDGLLSLQPVKPRGAQVLYSDLSFIFLGEIIEEAYGKPLDQVSREIFDALGMTSTGYLPPQSMHFAATEIRPGTSLPRRGRVHDETSEMLGGVAGHAGVFSTAEDLGRFCAAIIPDSCHEMFDAEWLRRAYANQTAHLDENRCLSWIAYGQRNEGNIVGHTGFTGTSLWIDTVSGDYVVLLTNRVHPTRANDAIMPLRRAGFQTVFGREIETSYKNPNINSR